MPKKNISNKKLDALYYLLESKKSENCPTKFIYDYPNYNYFDEQNGHIRIVKTIIELINEDEKGISLGLEGDWGSGKSTIIEMIRNYFNQYSDKVLVWVFDAWAHENDPLRRVFLENLVDGLKDNSWLSDSFAENKGNEISGKLKKQKIKRHFKKTFSSFIFLFSIVLSPIGISIFNNYFDSNICLINCSPFLNNKPELKFSILLALSPIIFILITIIYHLTIKQLLKLFYENFNNCESDKICDFFWLKFIGIENDFDDIFNIFVNKKFDVENQESLTTNEPTSIEFEQYFKDIVKEAKLDKDNQNRKLVIVLDNLDRIAPEHALSVLSTLQTFLQFSQQNNQENNPYKNVKVIIPYAFKSMVKLWTNKTKSEENLSKTSEMIDKRFHLVLKVPKLLMSEWKEFFINLLSEAFPEHINDLDLFKLIYNDLYNFLEKESYSFNSTENKIVKVNFPPSPRELIYLVNEMGIYHRSWCEKNTSKEFSISLKSIADFVILSRYFNNKSLSEIITTNLNIEFLEPNINKDLASLWYNAPKTKAIEILLEEMILENIDGIDSSTFSKYIVGLSNSYPSVWDIFEKLLNQNFFIKNRNFLFEIETIHELREKIKKINNKKTRNGILYEFKNHVLNFDKPNLLEKKLDNIFANKLIDLSFLYNNQSNDYQSEILFKLTQYVLNLLLYQEKDINNLAESLVNIIESINLSYLNNKKLELIIEEKAILSLFYQLSLKNKDYCFYFNFKIKQKPDETELTEINLSNHLNNIFNTYSKDSKKFNQILPVLLKREEEINWNNFIEKINSFTTGNNKIIEYKEATDEIFKHKKINISSLILNIQTIYTGINKYNNDIKILSWLFFHLYNSNPNLNLNNNSIPEPNKSEIVKIINNIKKPNDVFIENFVYYLNFFNSLEYIKQIKFDNINNNLIKNSIIYIIENYDYEIFNDLWIINNFDKIILNSNNEEKLEFTKSILKTNIESLLIEKEGEIYKNYKLSNLIVKAGSNEAFKKEILIEFEEFSKDEWENQFDLFINNQPSAINLLISLLTTIKKKIKNINYSDAVQNLIKKIARNEITINDDDETLISNLSILPSFITKKLLSSYQNQTISFMCNSELLPTMNDLIFKMFGNSLDNNSLSSENNIIDKLYIQLIKYKKENGILWFENRLKNDKLLIFPPDTDKEKIIPLKEQTSAVIKELVEESDSETYKSLEQIFSLLESLF